MRPTYRPYTPKKQAAALCIAFEYERAKEFTRDQIEYNKQRPIQETFWLEVMVELLYLAPRS